MGPGLLAAAGWCFFVPAEAYSAILMPTSGAVLVFWLLVWLIVRNEAPLSPARLFSVALLLGVTATGVEIFTLSPRGLEHPPYRA